MVTLSTEDKKGILNLYRRKSVTLQQIATVYNLPSVATLYKVLAELGVKPERAPRKPKPTGTKLPEPDPVTLYPLLRAVMNDVSYVLSDCVFSDPELQLAGFDALVVDRLRRVSLRLAEKKLQAA